MSSTRKTEDASRTLSKIALELGKRHELWNAIEQRMDVDTQQSDAPRAIVTKKRNGFNLGQLGAVIVALIVVASGITYGVHHQGVLKSTTAETDNNSMTSMNSTTPNVSRITVNNNQYRNTKFGFTVSIPTSWNKLYTLKSRTLPGVQALQMFYFNYIAEKSPQPFIVELVVYPKSYLGHLEQDPKVVKAFSNDRYSFAFYIDNRYPYPKSKHYAQYKQLQSKVPWVISHFKTSSRENRTTQTTQQLNPLFNTTLTLQTGQVVKPNSHSTRWKGLTLSLLVTGYPSANAGTKSYAAVIGNHANIISHESVSTPAGQATLVHFQRTPPAEAQSNTVRDEYDVIFFRKQYAYVLNALVSGNPSQAKNDIMQILSGWTIPKD
ncbi:hypothetical protein [Alicyclobacillus sp. SO9]|uniref:hypothetical protein n=1 Tax=Alicyclobacillus sp. SO9 TaxID=2665646 RepID=UPI0018E77C80|nr:hypothetical protein [Alicyclobacillus sp. SO9]QQE79644.1 hypothetical protein GI364_03910 [Alicyclobacillus sp. SO9]